jgi:hypothetical protein
LARKLTLVATTGLIGAAVFLTLGVGLSGRGWADARKLWGALPSTCGSSVSGGEKVTLPFVASDSLVIDLLASVQYQPGDTATAVVSGDPALIEHVRIEGGRLSLDCDPGLFASRLDVSLSAPAITNWELLGSSALSLSQINQPQLKLSIRGSGNVTAAGAVDTVKVDMAGSGTARLNGLTAKSAEIAIRGSGDAQITAQTEADVTILGSGSVEIFGHPILRRSDIMGSGRIVQVR